MAASSSATRICPLRMDLLSILSPSCQSRSLAGCEHRHQNPERGPPLRGLALDDAAVIADDLGDHSKTEARPLHLGGYERVEEMGLQFGGNARTVIAHAKFERQADPP